MMILLLIPLWILSLVLGVGGVVIAAAPAWGNDSLWWGAGVFVCNLIPVVLLLDAYQTLKRKNHEQDSKQSALRATLTKETTHPSG